MKKSPIKVVCFCQINKVRSLIGRFLVERDNKVSVIGFNLHPFLGILLCIFEEKRDGIVIRQNKIFFFGLHFSDIGIFTLDCWGGRSRLGSRFGNTIQ